MQDHIDAAADRLGVHLARRGLEQGQDLAGATADILVRLGYERPCRCRADVPITHLVVQRLLGRSDLLSRLVELDSNAPDWDWTQRALAHTDEVRRPEPGGRSLKLSAILVSIKEGLSEARRPQHGSAGHSRAGHR